MRFTFQRESQDTLKLTVRGIGWSIVPDTAVANRRRPSSNGCSAVY